MSEKCILSMRFTHLSVLYFIRLYKLKHIEFSNIPPEKGGFLPSHRHPALGVMSQLSSHFLHFISYRVHLGTQVRFAHGYVSVLL